MLDDIVDKYNKTCNGSVRRKPTDFKSGSYAEQNVDSNAKEPKLKIGDHVRVSKYINIFAKGWLFLRSFCY